MRRASILVVAVTLSLVSFRAAVAVAQSTSPTDGITPLGMTPGRPSGAFALSGFESVNLFNGNLSFALPLHHVGGRGEAGFTMYLPIARHWSLRLGNPVKTRTDEVDWYSAEWEIPGTKLDYSPGVMLQRSATQDVTRHTSNENWIISQTGLTRLAFRRGDGTESDFRDDEADGQPKEWHENKTPWQRGTAWNATDGSASTYISNDGISDPGAAGGKEPRPTPAGGQLLLAGGTEYTIGAADAPGRVARIRDRNGNIVTLTYTRITGSGVSLQSAKDSLGRTTTVSYGRQEPWTDTITYPGYGGGTHDITVQHAPLHDCLAAGETVKTYAELFPWVNFADGASTAFDPRVACKVILPAYDVHNDEWTHYSFAYNAYGELASVTLPTGGRIEYEWGSGVPGNPYGLHSLGPPNPSRVWSWAVLRRVKSRKVYNYDQLEQWTEYDDSECGEGLKCTISVRSRSADSTLLREEVHSFNSTPLHSLSLRPCDYAAWPEGRETSVEIYDGDENLLKKVESTWAQPDPPKWSAPFVGPEGQRPNNVRLTKTVTTIDDDGPHQFVVHYEYDAYNNVTARVDDAFGGAGVARRTERSYVADTAYVSGTNSGERVHIRNLPEWEQVKDGAGNVVSRTEFEYDSEAAGSLVTYDAVSEWVEVGTKRGNLTRTHRKLDYAPDGLDWADSLARYDVVGNIREATDPEGHTTFFDYSDNYGRSNALLSDISNFNTYARATQVKNAAGHQLQTQFDYGTGMPVDQKDANGVFTRVEYGDDLDRPTLVVRAANDPNGRESRTAFSYVDGRYRREAQTHQDQNVSGDGSRKRRTLYDELGRVWQTDEKVPGGPWLIAERRYDSLGRVSEVSNPYVAGEMACPHANCTLTDYDAIDRPVRVSLPDGAVSSTTYAGPFTTTADPTGRGRTSEADALGRVVSVIEPPGGAAATTTYSYDVLDNLTGVSQSDGSVTQTRTFVYDTLGRLRQATSPESGTTQYKYDKAGVLKWRKDARSVETTYSTDSLGRVRQQSYTGPGVSTPAVNFVWDHDGANRVPDWNGRLLVADNGFSNTTYGYDALGHVSASKQTTGGLAFPFSYQNDLVGNLVQETYPSGRQVSTTFDQLDRVTQVAEAGVTRAKDFVYAPHGGLQSVLLGNGLTQTARFNARLQPDLLGLTAGGAPLLSIAYQYWPDGASPQANNGNVWKQTIVASAPGVTSATFAQWYDYDGLNRLTTAQEAGLWYQPYSYDRWGNRVVPLTGQWPIYVPQPALTPRDFPAHIHKQTNRVTLGSSLHDAAGNQKVDPLGRYLSYDAENRQTEFPVPAAGAGQALRTTYAYDGEGRRVRSVGPNGTTVFVYDARGRLAAEYSDSSAVSRGVEYLTADTLGSVRIVTDGSGGVVSRHDFLPFAEEIGTSYGRTAAALKYGLADAFKQRFTGKERDGESGLDYFGARYFSSQQGRFTSPDPVFKSTSRIQDPQRWNGYGYVRNNPLLYVDPDGRDVFLGNREDLYRQGAMSQIAGFLRPGEAANLSVSKKGGRYQLALKDRSAIDMKHASGTYKELAGRITNAGVDITYYFVPKGGTVTSASEPGGISHSQLTGPTGSGGLTSYEFGSGRADVFVPEGGQPGGVAGRDGSQISFPDWAIAAHELLGETKKLMPSWRGLQSDPHVDKAIIIGIENGVRREFGVPERSGTDHPPLEETIEVRP